MRHPNKTVVQADAQRFPVANSDQAFFSRKATSRMMFGSCIYRWIEKNVFRP